MDDRHLTFIIVPHGELETRTFQISYRRLWLLLVAAASVLLLMCVFLALWFPALIQAARVPGLERELAELEKERARVTELAQSLTEVEAQYERVRQMLGADAAAAGEAPVLPPLRSQAAPNGSATESGAGQSAGRLTVWPVSFDPSAAVPRTQEPGEHPPSLDLAVPPSTEVKAAGPGSVRLAGEDVALGHFVVLDHGAGLETVYGHAARIYVKRGERVRAGQVIAVSGSSGRATAPHLHFEVRQNGKPVDPLPHLRRPEPRS